MEWLDFNANTYHSPDERLEERPDTIALDFHDIETSDFSVHNSTHFLQVQDRGPFHWSLNRLARQGGFSFSKPV